MLQVTNLTFEYLDTPILNKIQFSLEAGNLLHLSGPNGAGKTTLLRLLAGILHPRDGAIFWKGADIQSGLEAYQSELCYLGHKLGLSLALTVAENCFYAPSGWNHSIDFTQQLTQFGLAGHADSPCRTLSEGQRRRVALLRLSTSKARLWLLDEPWVALDTNAREALTLCLQAHLSKAGMVIMTSHQSLPDCFHDAKVYAL